MIEGQSNFKMGSTPHYELKSITNNRKIDIHLLILFMIQTFQFLDTDGKSLDLSAPAFTIPGGRIGAFDTRNTAFGRDIFAGNFFRSCNVKLLGFTNLVFSNP